MREQDAYPESSFIATAERMKMRRAHRVPLSPRAIEILDEAETLRDDTGLIFPSVRGKSLSDMALSKLVKELGFNVGVHGFRTSFRTCAQEQTNPQVQGRRMLFAERIVSRA